MFLYKFNKYTGKYYRYDTDDVDMFAPMFDEEIHPKDDNFQADYTLDPSLGLMCAFCKTEFDTRSQLFKHLGFMGLNIKKAREESYKKYDQEKGDFGLILKTDLMSARHSTKKRVAHPSELVDNLENLCIDNTKKRYSDRMDTDEVPNKISKIV